MQKFWHLVALLWFFACAAGVVAAVPAVENATRWAKLTPARQKVLAPLASDWDHYSTKTRLHFIALADHFPRMKPQAQVRIARRLIKWGSMTKQQRIIARNNYRKIQRLPPAKRAAVKAELRLAHARKLKKARAGKAAVVGQVSAVVAQKPAAAPAVAMSPTPVVVVPAAAAPVATGTPAR